MGGEVGEAGQRVEPNVTVILFTQGFIHTYCVSCMTGPRMTSKQHRAGTEEAPKSEASARRTVNQKPSHRSLGWGGSGDNREEEPGVTKDMGDHTQKCQTQNPSGSERSRFPAQVRGSLWDHRQTDLLVIRGWQRFPAYILGL